MSADNVVANALADWNQPGDKDLLLKISEPFGKRFLQVVEKAPQDTLKVWTLLDMETLQTWTKSRLALIGSVTCTFV